MWVYILSAIAVLMIIALAVGVAKIVKAYRLKAERAGYPSLSAYLNAAPRSDEEKRDAVDLALRGLVICLLGLVIPPFLVIGVIPFYYGARKMALASMGFGLFEDTDSTR